MLQDSLCSLFTSFDLNPCLMARRHICLHLKRCSFLSSGQIQLHCKSQLSSFIIDAALKGASSLHVKVSFEELSWDVSSETEAGRTDLLNKLSWI